MVWQESMMSLGDQAALTAHRETAQGTQWSSPKRHMARLKRQVPGKTRGLQQHVLVVKQSRQNSAFFPQGKKESNVHGTWWHRWLWAVSSGLCGTQVSKRHAARVPGSAQAALSAVPARTCT